MDEASCGTLAGYLASLDTPTPRVEAAGFTIILASDRKALRQEREGH